jgi:hypothetical protein
MKWLLPVLLAACTGTPFKKEGDACNVSAECAPSLVCDNHKCASTENLMRDLSMGDLAGEDLTVGDMARLPTDLPPGDIATVPDLSQND